MNPSRRRALLVTGLMGASAALAHFATPTVHIADRIGKPELEVIFPKTLPAWQVDVNTPVILPSPDVQAKLNAIYNQVLSRTYISEAGERVMLSVAYGGDQSDGTRAHRPEVCYPAQGFQILSNTRGALSVGTRVVPVRLLTSRLGSRYEPITYWMVVGGEVVTSGAEQKLVELRYGLKGLIPDGLLVRVSTIDVNAEHAFAVQARFVDALARVMPESARNRVFGGPLSLA